MGVFSVQLEVSNLEGREFVSLEAMVDTGSTYPLLPADLLRSLGVEPLRRRTFELGDGQIVELDDGEVRMRLEGQERTVPTVFAPEGAAPLLGAVALEIFGLAADPVNGRLVPSPPIRVRPI